MRRHIIHISFLGELPAQKHFYLIKFEKTPLDVKKFIEKNPKFLDFWKFWVALREVKMHFFLKTHLSYHMNHDQNPQELIWLLKIMIEPLWVHSKAPVLRNARKKRRLWKQYICFAFSSWWCQKHMFSYEQSKKHRPPEKRCLVPLLAACLHAKAIAKA